MKISNDIYLRMIEEVEDYAILLLDKAGNIESWNKGAEKIKGYKSQEVIGKNFRIFYTEEDGRNQLPEKLISEATANGKAIYEGWRVRKDGTTFWGNIVVTAIHNEDGSIAGFTKVTRDLTEKKRAEERLLQFNEELEQKVKDKTRELDKSEKLFRTISENNFDAISLRDEKGRIIYQSPGAEKIIGYTMEEANSIGAARFFHPDDIGDVMTRMDAAMKNPGQPIHGIHRVRHKNGHYIWLEGTVTNLLGDESVKALLGNFRDITERKHAEDKIVYANRLYAFISGINQTIVHARDEQTVFREACRIAVETGKFKVAWIGMINEADKKLNLIDECGILPEDIPLFINLNYENDCGQDNVLRTGSFYICNDIQTGPFPVSWKAFTAGRQWRSYMVLPIRKAGIVIATLNIISSERDFFHTREIILLEEVAGDISFALNVFEKEKHRTEAEDKLLHSQLRLKQAQAIAHVGSWEMNFLTGQVVWSEETYRMYGLTPEDKFQTQELWLSFIHPDDKQRILQILHEGESSLTNFSFQHRIIRKDGEVRHVYSQANFEFDAENRPTGLYGVVHDITETNEAEEALAQSEANLRLIMDLLPQFIFAKDINGKYLFVNKSFAGLYGLSPKELQEKTVTEAIPVKSESEYYITQDRDVILSGERSIMPEQFFTDYTGNKRLFHTIKVPFTMAGTNEKAVLGISNDITAQKKAEQERTKMVDDIVQRNKDLEQFSYIVSHNLRAPVANISGLAEILQIPALEKNDQVTLIAEIGNSVKKLDDVIIDLNYILQIKHKESKKKEVVIFSDLLNDIKLSIGHLIKSDNVLIISDFSGINEMLTVKSYLYSIFFNLISNSIKYRQPDIRPVIEITSARLANKITILLKDNGLGINLEKRGGQVFGLYKRFHSHVDGKGMGLFMVKTQVESLGGKIMIASEVNKGTEFRIEFEIS